MNPPRIGCVPYLNARPLVHGIEGVEYLPPAALSEAFRRGCYDAALIPVFEALRLEQPRLVDGCSISCRGPVLSVVVAHERPLASIRQIACDPDSRSSNALAAVLLDQLAPAASLVEGPAEARIVIGDPALQLRLERPDLYFTDLGEAWFRVTGLPFVFAAWCLAPGAHSGLAGQLRAAVDRGIAAIPDIASHCPQPDRAMVYLSEHIHYGLGSEEKAGMAEFARRAASCGLIDQSAPWVWV
ncbi:MAG: menaquinone biosynthesis protein [Terrimicrobiaceae bacterium]